jgi:hypothetical protein
MNITTKFNLHDILRDAVSGFQGEVLAISRYATGCTHYGIAPKHTTKDGKIMEWEWLDESRLVLVEDSEYTPAHDVTGGPDMNPACK